MNCHNRPLPLKTRERSGLHSLHNNLLLFKETYLQFQYAEYLYINEKVKTLINNLESRIILYEEITDKTNAEE